MKERPILFSGPMVKAILAGRKTQTRRVVEPLPSWQVHSVCDPNGAADPWAVWFHYPDTDRVGHLRVCPYGVPGDRLWVKETCFIWARWCKNGFTKSGRQRWRFKVENPHTVVFDPNHPQVATRKTPRETCMYWRRPSIFMPRWASRLTLEITDVRVQRLQEISASDVLAEGVDNGKSNPAMGVRWENMQRMAFEELWDSINAKRGHGWEKNDWVWALTFGRVAA